MLKPQAPPEVARQRAEQHARRQGSALVLFGLCAASAVLALTRLALGAAAWHVVPLSLASLALGLSVYGQHADGEVAALRELAMHDRALLSAEECREVDLDAARPDLQQAHTPGPKVQLLLPTTCIAIVILLLGESFRG